MGSFTSQRARATRAGPGPKHENQEQQQNLRGAQQKQVGCPSSGIRSLLISYLLLLSPSTIFTICVSFGVPCLALSSFWAPPPLPVRNYTAYSIVKPNGRKRRDLLCP